MTYEQFPFLLFYRLMMKGQEVADRAIRMGVIPVSKVQWQKIKMQWEASHEDSKGDQHLEAKKKVLDRILEVNQNLIVISWLMTTKKDPKPVMEAARMRWIEDPIERQKHFNKMLNKAKTELGIFEAQLARLNENQEKEDDNIDYTMAMAYDAITSLEISGATIPDYSKFTLGQYDSWTRIINKQKEAQALKESA